MKDNKTRNIPKYIINKINRIEKYRDMISELSGDVDNWLLENTGLDSVNNKDLQKIMYEVKYGCGSAIEIINFVSDNNIEFFKGD